MINKVLGFLMLVVVLFSSCKKETRDLREVQDVAIKEFLTKNNLTLEFTKDSSGFYYQILDSGNLELPVLSYADKVAIGQKTVSINESLNYENSFFYPMIDFVGYIKPTSWREAIRKVRKGAVIRVITPSYLAFGKGGSGLAIPGNSILDTKIEIADDTDREVYEEKLIQRFMTENNIPGIKDTSGLYYQIISPGTGASAELTSTVKTAYTGRILSGVVFETASASNAISGVLSGYIKGWIYSIPKIKVGGKIRVIIPSRLAYGESGAGSSLLRPNTPLDFDIELLEVIN